MLKKILIGLAVVLVILIAVIAMQPSEFRVERTVNMTAPAAVIFPHVNNFHKMEVWSPWSKMDPNAKGTYEGAPEGVGAMYSWEGEKTGAGKMTILESIVPTLIRIKLEFFKPMATVNSAEFNFKESGNQTAVTWSMAGKCDFSQKTFGLFMNMDKMVGTEFEKGLNDLKKIAELEAQTPPPAAKAPATAAPSKKKSKAAVKAKAKAKHKKSK